jgi:molybdate/tungstate transport system ATP-binding protein
VIETHNLAVAAGDFLLEDVSFAVPPGAYCVLMGRSGSGKTTLLESLCGLRKVIRGKILIDGRDVTHAAPRDRGIGLAPQDGALFNHMTIREHLDFALRIRGASAAECEARVSELAELLHIGHLLARRPFGLSGGERQRTAMGRALAFRPHVLCLDEPLSALDDETRQDMIRLLKRVQTETGVTVLHVTHNRLEAAALADLHLRIDRDGVREADDDEIKPDGFDHYPLRSRVPC